MIENGTENKLTERKMWSRIVYILQLAKSQEGSYDKVYEIELHAAFVAQIHNLEKVQCQ